MDSEVVIGFEELSYNGTEPSGEIQVVVGVLQGELSEDVAVRIYTEDGTALSPSDYTSVDMILTFSPTNNRITVTVSLEDDDIDEEDEFLIGRLELDPSGTQTSVQIQPAEARLIILDDDGTLKVLMLCCHLSSLYS